MSSRPASPAPGSAQRDWWWDGISAQCNVVGALIMRELHTRYGRENIGYLWMILEPGLLAAAVAAIHAGQKTHYGSDIRTVPFALIGYGTFIMFRSIFNRGESTIDANKPLLYHRMVTLFDMLLARALLEGAATFATLTVLMSTAILMGWADPPVRPLQLGLAILLLLWFSLAMSMLVCAVAYDNKLVVKFIHPATYLMMPISGAFFELLWIPEPYRSWLAWFPMAQIFELARYGVFESCTDRFVNLGYIIICNLVLTYAGLLSLQIVRRHVHL